MVWEGNTRIHEFTENEPGRKERKKKREERKKKRKKRANEGKRGGFPVAVYVFL